MVQKNLQAKIKYLILWTVTFCILHFGVGCILITNLLSKFPDYQEIYNLLKDSLSITATFLAPVTALILFNTWREQYLLTLLDSTTRKFLENMQDLEYVAIKAYQQALEKNFDSKIIFYEHPIKGSLPDIARSIEMNLKIIINLNKKAFKFSGDIYDLTVSVKNIEQTIVLLKEALSKKSELELSSIKDPNFDSLLNDIQRYKKAHQEDMNKIKKIIYQIEQTIEKNTDLLL